MSAGRKPYGRSELLEIVKPRKIEDALEFHELRDDGLYVRSEQELRGMGLPPGDVEEMRWTPSGDVSTAALPLPCDAHDMAAFMVAGGGVDLREPQTDGAYADLLKTAPKALALITEALALLADARKEFDLARPRPIPKVLYPQVPPNPTLTGPAAPEFLSSRFKSKDMPRGASISADVRVHQPGSHEADAEYERWLDGAQRAAVEWILSQRSGSLAAVQEAVDPVAVLPTASATPYTPRLAQPLGPKRTNVLTGVVTRALDEAGGIAATTSQVWTVLVNMAKSPDRPLPFSAGEDGLVVTSGGIRYQDDTGKIKVFEKKHLDDRIRTIRNRAKPG